MTVAVILINIALCAIASYRKYSDEKKVWFRGMAIGSIFFAIGAFSVGGKDGIIAGVILIIAAALYIHSIYEVNWQDEQKRKWKRERPYREEREREIQETEKAKKVVETTAMNKAMDYERNNYRNPVDVSSQNVGYDIKSSGSNETRFIEVKGKGNRGDIEITSNEWNTAKELENSYFLYVVYDCSDYPNLKIVQNPTKKLGSDYDSYNNKYRVSNYEVNGCSN